MLRQIVKDYSVVTPLAGTALVPQGGSVAQKGMIFHILPDNAAKVEVLDIGFGTGTLGELVKGYAETAHWSVDGVDGFEANCANPALLEKKVYRNLWHGLAQEIPADRLASYRIICLLDIIEHLTVDTAKWLLRTLLSAMGDDAFLFVSTPLWYYPQGMQQAGDLEEHLIGVPATSMMALIPMMYSVTSPLVGSFVLGKRSLDYVDFFQPTADRGFSYAKGLAIASAINLQTKPGVIFKLV